jgi:hypothetical protein
VLTFTLAIIGAVTATVATAAALWQGLILRKQLANEIFVRRASFHQSIANLFVQLDFIFINNPELRPYFYHNKKPSDPLVKHQAAALCEYIVDLAESCIAAESVLPELVGDWDDYFNYLYRHSHALRRYWADFGHLFPPGVRRALIGPSARPKHWPGRRQHDMMSDSQLGAGGSSDAGQ